MTLPMVLHVRVVTGSGGGPDKTILRSAAYAQGGGVSMAAAFIHPAGDTGIELLQQKARVLNCPFYALPEGGPLSLETARSLLHLCRQLHVAVWHAHDYKSNVLGLLLRRLWPMKLVTTAHGWTSQTARVRLYQSMDHLSLPRYDQVMAVSRPLLAACRAAGVPANRLSYLPNGIEVSDFARWSDPQTIRAEMGVQLRGLIMGVVGRLSPEKGVDRAIHLLAQLREKYPHIELHVVGDGPQRQSLEELAASLGVNEAVRFWGWQAQAKRFYEMMDLLLLPSHTEGLPNVVLEAMAMEVCVAATKVGDVPELLDKGRCGLLLSRDAARWAASLAPLLSSAPRRQELARRARERVEKHYSFAARAAAEIEVYRNVLSLSGGALRMAS